MSYFVYHASYNSSLLAKADPPWREFAYNTCHAGVYNVRHTLFLKHNLCRVCWRRLTSHGVSSCIWYMSCRCSSCMSYFVIMQHIIRICWNRLTPHGVSWCVWYIPCNCITCLAWFCVYDTCNAFICDIYVQGWPDPLMTRVRAYTSSTSNALTCHIYT